VRAATLRGVRQGSKEARSEMPERVKKQ